MKRSKFFFNHIVAFVILNSLILGACSKDDSGDGEPVSQRPQITMTIPTSGNIDWNTVKLVWSEEFNESARLEDIWVFEANNKFNPDVADQLQIYRDKSVKLSDGKLKIYAEKNDGVYTSARLNGKYAYKYGRIEISSKLPGNEKNGLWAKFALLGENINTVGWPKAGEIDLMEYFSYNPNKTFINVHSAANNAANGTLISATNNLESVEEQFHAYGILWTDKYIKFYVDTPNNIIHTLNRPSSPNEMNWPFDQHFYLLVDLVIGGRHAGAQGVDDSLFPAIWEIDYIRVYHPL